MRTTGLIAYLIILIALYRGITGWLGEEFMANFKEFMFRPYIDYYHLHLEQIMPGWSNPFVIIILVAYSVMFFWNWFPVSQMLCCFVIAFFTFDLGFWYLDPARGSPPDPDWFLFSMMAAGWMIVAHAISEQLFWAWLRDKLDGRA